MWQGRHHLDESLTATNALLSDQTHDWFGVRMITWRKHAITNWPEVAMAWAVPVSHSGIYGLFRAKERGHATNKGATFFNRPPVPAQALRFSNGFYNVGATLAAQSSLGHIQAFGGELRSITMDGAEEQYHDAIRPFHGLPPKAGHRLEAVTESQMASIRNSCADNGYRRFAMHKSG